MLCRTGLSLLTALLPLPGTGGSDACSHTRVGPSGDSVVLHVPALTSSTLDSAASGGVRICILNEPLICVGGAHFGKPQDGVKRLNLSYESENVNCGKLGELDRGYTCVY